MFNANIYNYRVRIINHETGEICEQYYDDLDYAKTCYTGVIVALGIVWNSDCEYYIEHRTDDDEWERVPDEDDTVDPEGIDDEDVDYFDEEWDLTAGYSQNAPCDNTGFCIGSACKYYRNCTE